MFFVVIVLVVVSFCLFPYFYRVIVYSFVISFYCGSVRTSVISGKKYTN